MEWDNREQIAFAKIVLRRWVQSQLSNSLPRILWLNYLIIQLQMLKKKRLFWVFWVLAEYESFIICRVQIQMKKRERHSVLLYYRFDTVLIIQEQVIIIFNIFWYNSSFSLSSGFSPSRAAWKLKYKELAFPLFEQTAVAETFPFQSIPSNIILMARKFYKEIKMLISINFSLSLCSHFLFCYWMGEMICCGKPVSS